MILVGLAVLTIWALMELWPVILLVVTAFILTAAFLPYVEWLVQRGLPRVAAALIFLLAVLGIIAGLFALVVPTLVDGFHNIRNELPEDAKAVRRVAGQVQRRC